MTAWTLCVKAHDHVLQQYCALMEEHFCLYKRVHVQTHTIAYLINDLEIE